MNESASNGRTSGAASPATTSTSLLARVKAQDPQAWQRLVDLYGPLVYHWCCRFGVEPQDAADVFQNVFSSVHKAIDRFEQRAGGGTFRGWLWTITRNAVRDYHGKQAGRAAAAGGTDAQMWLAQVPEQWDEASSDATQTGEVNGVFHRAVESVRGEFEPRTWDAFWKVAVEGRSTTEVAAELGITTNGVRQAKSRVLRRLRAQLGDSA